MQRRHISFRRRPSHEYLLLAVITLMAGLLRFYRLGEWSFWGDEMFTIGGREDGFNYTIGRQSVSLALIRASVDLLGTSEWSARLVPALIGVASIPALYFMVRRAFNPDVGLVTALLLAVSPWHLYWSQNARFYTALLLFYSLGLFAFHIGIEEDRPAYLLICVILFGLAAKERLIALFFMPVILGYVVVPRLLRCQKPPGLRWRNTLPLALVGLMFSAFFAGPYLRDLPQWLDNFGRVNNSPFWILAGVAYYVGIPTMCMGALGALYLLLAKSRAGLLLALGAAIPLLGIMGIAPFHYTASRYVFVSLVSWLTLAAVAAVELFRQTQIKGRVLAVGVLVLLLLSPLGEDVLYYWRQNGNRADWRAAFGMVAELKQDGDLVVAANPELGDYYLREPSIGWSSLDLSGIERHGGRVWFVEDVDAQEVSPDVHRWLEEHAHLVAVLDVHARARNFMIRVYLYDRAVDISETMG